MNPGNDSEPGPRYYARASVRIRAALTDSVLFGVSLLTLLLLFEALDTSSAIAMPAFFAWVVAVFLYEPVLLMQQERDGLNAVLIVFLEPRSDLR